MNNYKDIISIPNWPIVRKLQQIIWLNGRGLISLAAREIRMVKWRRDHMNTRLNKGLKLRRGAPIIPLMVIEFSENPHNP